MICQECIKYDKKIQILQSDFQFQLRKLSEDKASQKALYEIGVQKQIRKLQQKCNKQKSDHEQNQKKWFQKIDEFASQYKNKIKHAEQECQNTIMRQRQKCLKQYRNMEVQLKSKHNEQIKRLSLKYESQIEQKQNRWRDCMTKKDQQHTKEINNINKVSTERQSKKKNQYQSLILGLKSQLNAELRCNSSNQEEFRRQKMRVISQLYTHKQKIISLQSSLSQLKTKLLQREQTIKLKQQQIQNLNLIHQDNIKSLKDHFESLLRQQQAKLNEKIKYFCENQLQITEKYESSIRKIQENRNIEIKLYESNMKQIKNCVEKRPSRLEDVQQILILREKLAKKEKQYEVLQKQMKNYQLQLQNKQDVYNKIFIPTINSTQLYGENIIKRKELKLKRPVGKSVSTVRQILNGVVSNNLPMLNNLQKKLLPPKANKIL